MSTTYILGSINRSHGSDYDVVPEGPIAGLPTPMPSVTDAIYPHLTWSTLWFSLLCLFVAFNMKNMPFMWHMRLVNAFRFVLRTQRSAVPLKPTHIFQPIITSSTAQLMEIDFNIHKSNSSYFSDADIARAHLVCTLFAKGIEQMRGGTAAYTGSGKPLFGFALGAVSCNFKREIRPQEQYEMWSKILTWDEKWIYIVTHFVRKDAVKPKNYTLYPEQFPDQGSDEKSSSSDEGGDVNSDKVIFATALSKCVFKAGRKTVSPDTMFQISGLLPAGNSEDKEFDEVTLRQIEEQRQKGLVTAQSLTAQTQQNLEAEFDAAGCEALGKHTDGAGIVGVVNTLMQLARLKKSQIL
ncbi:uncharacterized protein GGS22DRAFT_172726 [Annulohypoxylon maeteangense]|uniref:uncharacterized protein n=1 Tax=Annulohypoxylon maeteangense TaxID=1927788 RepID=UPI002007E988|nr:uncharacterized protein GGS22DRAFT_172726 [Annulohypoxylon maeteangense]KAI0881232.1 hypothetical protein GGS22DRAFT_172726 [Annulohypoxylon maeteangense]